MKSLCPALWLITGLPPRRPRVDRTRHPSSPAAGPQVSPLPPFRFPFDWRSINLEERVSIPDRSVRESSLRAACKVIPQHSGLSITGKFHSSLLIVSWSSGARVCHHLQSPSRVTLTARCAPRHCQPINTGVIPNSGQIVFCGRGSGKPSWILNHTNADAAPSFLCFVFKQCACRTKSNYFQANTLDWK